MRILHLLNHIHQLGNGIVNVAVDLACLQARAGHDVAIASAGGDYQDLLAQYHVKHFLLDQTRTPLNLLKAAHHYRQIIADFSPDIVHVHMMTGVVLAWALKLSSSYVLVSTVHNEFQRSAILMGLGQCVIAVSHAVAKSLEKRGIPAEKLRVVLNGPLGSPRTPPLDTYSPLPLRGKVITTVAGMYERKGISELITAFAEIAEDFPDAHLYLVGNGPDRAKFEAQAQKTPVSHRIHFEGFQANPQAYLRSTDIFVLASRREPFGLAIAEAREAGCAIIASRVDGIPEALDQGKAGWLVSPKDISAIAEALRQLLSDPQLLKQYQECAQQRLERLTVARVHQEVLSLYQEHLCQGITDDQF